MMDKDTAVNPQRKLIVPTAQGWYDSAHDYSGEHDYSPGERLLFMENALNHTENALFASNQKIAEQAKYAELGKAAEKARNNQCPFNGKYDFMSRICKRCIIQDYCKRAELRKLEG